MDNKSEHIDYSNLPDDLDPKTKRFDPMPEPGDDGRELDRIAIPGKAIDSVEALTTAFDKDTKVSFEVMDLFDSLEGWVTRKAVAVRSKPARDVLSDLQDWIEAKRDSEFDR